MVAEDIKSEAYGQNDDGYEDNFYYMFHIYVHISVLPQPPLQQPGQQCCQQ